MESFMKFNLHKTLKGKFFIMTLCIMITIAVSTTIFSSFMFSKNLQNNKIHAAETNLQFMRSRINTYLDDIDKLAMWCQSNQYIINYVKTPPSADNYSSITIQAHERLTEEYLRNSASPYISRIIIGNTKNKKYLQQLSDTFYSLDKPWNQVIQALPYYQELIDAPDYSFLLGVQPDPFLKEKEWMLPIIRPINSPYNNTTIGFCYIQISFNMFIDSLSEYSTHENLPVFLTIHDSVYKVDKHGTTLMDGKPDTSPSQVDSLNSEDTQVHLMKKENNIVYYVTSNLQNEGIFISIPVYMETPLESFPEFSSILYVIIIAVIVFGIIVYAFLSYTVRLPVSALIKQLNRVSKGDFKQNPEIEWDNEFGEIGHHINLLSTNISTLLDQRITNEKLKKDYEYQMLQSQINPHFMYNTLNSIKWMAIAQQANGIAEMTTSLAHLFKNISKGTSTLITLEDELDLLNDYFTIQKYRYGGSISLKYDIEDEALLNNAILRFTLQPIVENAIFHGIEPKGTSGTILIRIFKKTSSVLEIEVTDDGIGMTEETIRNVLDGTTSERSNFFKQIGIASVNKRIQYNFGLEYGMSIESKPQKYTTVHVLLPLNLQCNTTEDQTNA